MSTVVLAHSRHQTRTIKRLQPLLTVLAWELRRLAASRTAWFLAPATFAVCLLVLSLQGTGNVDIQVSPGVFYGGTRVYLSVWDLLNRLGSGVIALLTIVLFFVCTDAVARDLKRRTHELVMATPVPTWAYVWGRYLSIVLVCLGLAVELLAALLASALVLRLTVSGDIYPTPHIDQILAIWASLVLPVVLFFSSLSFALGTLLPARTNLVKGGLFITWAIESFIFPGALHGGLATWYTNWDPSGGNILEDTPDRYRRAYLELLRAAGLDHQPQTAATNSQALQLLRTVEYRYIDFWSWFSPHLIWTALGLGLVIVVALTFQRFRNV